MVDSEDSDSKRVVEDRKGNAVALLGITFFFIIALMCFFGLNILAFFIHWSLPLLFFSWCFVDIRPFNGEGRASKWLRRHVIHKFNATYFPLDLVVKDEEDFKDSSSPFLFTIHPHGLVGAG